MKKFLIGLILATVVAVSAVGCTSMQSFLDASGDALSSEVVQDALAQAAVIKVIEGTEHPVNTAMKIYALASVPPVDAGVAELDKRLKEALEYEKMDVSMQILVDTAVAQFKANIEKEALPYAEAVAYWQANMLAASSRYLSAQK